jgi:hypothetical protein
VTTPTYPIVSSFDGPRITVDDYLKDPMRIPALVLSIMANEFIIETVLRNAGNNQSGAVRYERSTPLYAQNDSGIRAEFAEVPQVTGAVGDLLVAYTYERALAISVSDEMRRRQIIDPVNRQLTQVKNTMVKNWNQAFFTLLDQQIVAANQIYTVASAEAWDATTMSEVLAPPYQANIIRGHISDGIWAVENAAATGQPQNFFEFEPDTLIIDHTAKLALFKSEDFAKPYLGDAATSSIQYTGVLPRKIMNLDVLVSRQCPAGHAYICQRNRLGFFSDEVPLTASPLYRDEPRKLWRSDVQRAAAMGLDQPKAVVRLDGVTTNTVQPFGEPGAPGGVGAVVI